MRLLIATRNTHKVQEIGRMLEGLSLQAASLKEFPRAPEVEEDGRTLEENAAKKAVWAARATGLWSLADDTGLEVEALLGSPGIYSARYAGPDADYKTNNRKLLKELRSVPMGERRAVFRCVMALSSPDGRVLLEEGRLEGLILEHPKGRNGFGYDPLFLLQEQGKTLAELAPEEKNVLSHRSSAMRRMRPHLERIAQRSICPRCGLDMETWHCRVLCRNCGYQIDCSDPFS